MTDWYSKNKLGINYASTYVMFITNIIITLSKTKVIEDAEIEVVQKFKLLGVTKEKKLYFNNNANENSRSHAPF